jgi:hypothetical protein
MDVHRTSLSLILLVRRINWQYSMRSLEANEEMLDKARLAHLRVSKNQDSLVFLHLIFIKFS